MTELIAAIKSFFVLFLIIMVLLQLVPGEKLKKYIHFFSNLILLAGVLYPVLSYFGGETAFLEKVQYETYTKTMEELEKDASRMTFMQNEYYLEKYGEAVNEEVYRMAQSYAQDYGLAVQKAEAPLNENYVVEGINVLLKEADTSGEESGVLAEGKKQGNKVLCEKLRLELAEYYQVDEREVYVSYTGND